MAQHDPENEVHTERTSPASIMLPTIVKLSRNSLSIMDVTSACNREYMEAAENGNEANDWCSENRSMAERMWLL